MLRIIFQLFLSHDLSIFSYHYRIVYLLLKKEKRIIGNKKWRKEISFQILYNRNIKNIRNSFTTSKETIDLPEILQIENSNEIT